MWRHCWCSVSIYISCMMTSSNGNIFRVIGHLCGQFTGQLPHKGQRRGALMFSLICAWMNGWVNTLGVGDLRRHRAHYDVTVMVVSCVKMFLVHHLLHSVQWSSIKKWTITIGYFSLSAVMVISRQNFQDQGPSTSWGQHGAHLGPTGPRCAPCWPHELCYLGIHVEYFECMQISKHYILLVYQ